MSKRKITHTLKLVNSKGEENKFTLDAITDMKWSDIHNVIVANVHTIEHGAGRIIWPIDKIFIDDQSLEKSKLSDYLFK